MVFLTKELRGYIDALCESAGSKEQTEILVKAIVEEERQRILSELPNHLSLESFPFRRYCKNLYHAIFFPRKQFTSLTRAALNFARYKVQDVELPQ